MYSLCCIKVSNGLLQSNKQQIYVLLSTTPRDWRISHYSTEGFWETYQWFLPGEGSYTKGGGGGYLNHNQGLCEMKMAGQNFN